MTFLDGTENISAGNCRKIFFRGAFGQGEFTLWEQHAGEEVLNAGILVVSIFGCVLPVCTFSESRRGAGEEHVVPSLPRKSFPVPLWALAAVGPLRRAAGRSPAWGWLRGEHPLPPAPSLVPAALEVPLGTALAPNPWVWIR